MKESKSYLKFSALSKIIFWDFYSLSNKNIIVSKYPIVSLKEVLTQRKGFITIDDSIVYKRCRAQVQAKGVVLRDEIIGKKIKTKKQQFCKTDDFLVAEIDAKVGGYGIVPDYLEGAIVSGHYFLFEIDRAKLLPEYLGVVVKLNDFAKQVKATGSTNYAAIRPYHVLEYVMPLPTLEEQERIVNAFNEKIESAIRLEKEAEELEKGIEKYLHSELGVIIKHESDNKTGKFLDFINYQEIERWALSHIFKNQLYSFKNAKYDIMPIKALLKSFDGGKTPSTSQKEFWQGNVNWFSAKDMKSLKLVKSEDFITTFALDNACMKLHPEGTILGVFRSGILRHSFPVAILEEPATINQDLKAMNFDSSLVFNKYALYYMHVFQKMILEQAQKVGVTVESLNTDEFLEVPFVLPPMKIQKTIVKTIEDLKTNIGDLKNKSELLKKEASQEFEKEIFN